MMLHCCKSSSKHAFFLMLQYRERLSLISSKLREQYLRVFKFLPKPLKSACICFLSNFFCPYVNETLKGSFLFTVDNLHAVYITSVNFFCIAGLETLINVQSNIAVLTIVYSLSSFVMLTVENTPSCWFTFLFCGRYSFWEVGFC